MSANSNRLPRSAQVYSALAALEGTAWALSLVLLPAANESAAVLQLVLTVAVLLGTLLAFAPAGMPWIAFAVPLGFAQLTFLLSRDLPLRRDHARDVGDDIDRRGCRLLFAAARAVEQRCDAHARQ